MLKEQDVDSEEERLREMAAALPNDKRKAFYREASQRLKDPDTYATLNWFFLVGLHHFYLGRWERGLIDLGVCVLGLVMLFAEQVLLGSLLIGAVALLELWTLFRAQVIVQDWNNQIYRRLLQQYGATIR